MRHIHTLSIFLTLILLSSAPLAHAQRGVELKSRDDLNHKSSKLGGYRALLIGIDKYRDPKIPSLKTAVNDARELANLLQNQYGFKVELLLDEQATRKAITQKLRDLAVRSTPDESVLIYYAGHGEIDRELNDGYWVPANAKGGDATTYVDNTVVQKVMKGMKAKHVLLISDSCYSGTLFGEGRSLPPIIDDKFYLNLYNEKSRWGMTSGNKTPVSDSGSEGHSIFAYQLLKALKRNEKPYVTTQEIYSRIAPIIANNSEQQPLCLPVRNAGDQGGGFVFVASTFSTLSAMDSPSYLPKASPRVDKVFLDDQEEDVRLDEERRKLDKEKALLEKRKALDEKRRKVEEEKARHETEQQEAAEQRQLEAEQRRVEKERAALMKQKALEEKRRKVEEEKVRLAEEIEEAAAAAAKRAAKANKTTTLAMVKRPSQSTAGETGRDVYGQEKGTAKEAKDIVAKAIAYYKANGMDKTFAAINDPGGQFTKKDLYVFALDFNTVCLAHGANKALIGKNLTELKDSNGKQFLNVMTQGAKTKGKGWVDYNWINPTSKKIEAKSSYYQKEGDFYFGCGIYK